MTKLMLSIATLALIVLAAPAQATNLRTWVSASGTDTGTCPQTAPCQTFAFAITQTSSGGEIDCLSGGDFGAVTISNPITIDCGAGQVGSIGLPSSGTAIYVPATSGTIVLRNLTLNGFGASFNTGINAPGFSGTLVVQNCDIHGFLDGIVFGSSSGRGLLEVSDTSIHDNGNGNGGYGIVVYPTASGAIESIVLNRVEITNNGNGVYFEGLGTVAGTLRQSLVAYNAGAGVQATSAGGVYFTVEESSVIDNLGDGIQSDHSGVNLEVGASTIGGNGTGIAATAGAIYSFRNNQMSTNGTNGSFTPGGAGLQ